MHRASCDQRQISDSPPRQPLAEATRACARMPVIQVVDTDLVAMVAQRFRLDWCYDEAADAMLATGRWHMVWRTI